MPSTFYFMHEKINSQKTDTFSQEEVFPKDLITESERQLLCLMQFLVLTSEMRNYCMRVGPTSYL